MGAELCGDICLFFFPVWPLLVETLTLALERGTWHFGARNLHIMGTCRWCPSRADQATQERSESMLTDPRRLQFLSWARFLKMLWHWTALPINPVTSRSPCLSHLPVSEPGGEFSGLSIPWTSHDGLWQTRKFLPKTRWNLRWKVGGKLFFGGLNLRRTSTKISLRNFTTTFPAGKKEFRHIPATTKSKFRGFHPKFSHVQNQHLDYPVCLVPPLSQPHCLVLSYASKPSLEGYLLYWLCERSWKRA